MQTCNAPLEFAAHEATVWGVRYNTKHDCPFDLLGHRRETPFDFPDQDTAAAVSNQERKQQFFARAAQGQPDQSNAR